MELTSRRIGWFTALVAKVGAQLIYVLIWVFGRTHRRADIPWLAGPLGSETIGDAPYREIAAPEGLTIERHAHDGGLVPSFEQLLGTVGGHAIPSPLTVTRSQFAPKFSAPPLRSRK